MRRAEFEVKDKAAFEALLSECEYGTLSLVDEGEPYGVPVNFVWRDGAICFHGKTVFANTIVLQRHRCGLSCYAVFCLGAYSGQGRKSRRRQ